MSFQLAPKAFWWTELISQFFCYSNSSKNITCLTGKLKTEFTSPITKSTSPGLLNTAFFACWRTDVHWCLGTEHELKFCGISDLFTASKDKSLQAVDMNTGGVAHAVNKAHKYGCFDTCFCILLILNFYGTKLIQKKAEKKCCNENYLTTCYTTLSPKKMMPIIITKKIAYNYFFTNNILF